MCASASRMARRQGPVSPPNGILAMIVMRFLAILAALALSAYIALATEQAGV